MHRGYIKLWRKTMDNFISTDPFALALWVHLLWDCNHEDKEFIFNYQKHTVKRGQTITGLHVLSKKTGMNKSKLERLLKMLESEKLIEKQSNNKYSLITVINYDKYQSCEKQSEKPVRNNRETTENKQELIITNKNYKNNIDTFHQYWLSKVKKGESEFWLTELRRNAIRSRLEEGRTIDDLKRAADNYFNDDWDGRKKFAGWERYEEYVLRTPETLEAWINKKKKHWLED